MGYRSESKGSWLSAAVSGESVLSVVFTKVFVCMQIYCKFSIVNGNVLSIQPRNVLGMQKINGHVLSI